MIYLTRLFGDQLERTHPYGVGDLRTAQVRSAVLPGLASLTHQISLHSPEIRLNGTGAGGAATRQPRRGDPLADGRPLLNPVHPAFPGRVGGGL